MRIKYFCFILIPLMLWGCLQQPETIKDVRDLPQDHTAYVNNTPQEKNIIPSEAQAKSNEDYNTTYFSVWHILQPAHSSPEKLSLIFKKFAANPGYGENKKKHSAAWLKKLQQNASLDNYPNALQPAITTRNTNLRMLPTQGPHFYSSEGDIAGWPFDNLQISSVTANTPIIIFHLSADKSWALVETSFAFGWMPVEDYARVDDNFIKMWESGRYAVIIKDKASIFDADGNFSLRTSIGQIFPLVNETADQLEILTATADKNNWAVIKHSLVSRQVITPKPLLFTYINAVKIANELIDEPYGWGGLYGNRDCSSMTRDFFAPFGIWLPRHSEDQAKKAGAYINLQNLDPDQKEKIILEQGIPYLSLLWRKGHIMLYIGEQNGRALIFHNVWGLKTIDFTGKEGRKIIGKAVITTLYPGAELYSLDPRDGLLIKTISGMTVLMPEKQSPQTRQNDLISQEHDH
ncbi:MAG: NlpC/P60 family N-terminal domain-containing protein [Smithella sp.]